MQPSPLNQLNDLNFKDENKPKEFILSAADPYSKEYRNTQIKSITTTSGTTTTVLAYPHYDSVKRTTQESELADKLNTITHDESTNEKYTSFEPNSVVYQRGAATNYPLYDKAGVYTPYYKLEPGKLYSYTNVSDDRYFSLRLKGSDGHFMNFIVVDESKVKWDKGTYGPLPEPNSGYHGTTAFARYGHKSDPKSQYPTDVNPNVNVPPNGAGNSSTRVMTFSDKGIISVHSGDQPGAYFNIPRGTKIYFFNSPAGGFNDVALKFLSMITDGEYKYSLAYYWGVRDLLPPPQYGINVAEVPRGLGILGMEDKLREIRKMISSNKGGFEELRQSAVREHKDRLTIMDTLKSNLEAKKTQLEDNQISIQDLGAKISQLTSTLPINFADLTDLTNLLQETVMAGAFLESEIILIEGTLKEHQAAFVKFESEGNAVVGAIWALIGGISDLKGSVRENETSSRLDSLNENIPTSFPKFLISGHPDNETRKIQLESDMDSLTEGIRVSGASSATPAYNTEDVSITII